MKNETTALKADSIYPLDKTNHGDFNEIMD